MTSPHAPLPGDERRPELRVDVVAVLTVVLAAALVATLIVWEWHRHVDEEPASCVAARAAWSARAAHDTGSGPRVVVLGDSYSAGTGLHDPALAWTRELPGQVHVDAFPGSGFSADASPCTGVAYADRARAAVAHGASLVLVQGGLNDTDRSDDEILDGFERTLRALGPWPVAVVGPPPVPSLVDRAIHVDRLLRHLCRDDGVPYISTTDQSLVYLPDGLHPTQGSQDVLGRLVVRRLEARHLLQLGQ